jgi:hypothetical protein
MRGTHAREKRLAMEWRRSSRRLVDLQRFPSARTCVSRDSSGRRPARKTSLAEPYRLDQTCVSTESAKCSPKEADVLRPPHLDRPDRRLRGTAQVQIMF